jgi:hypothetical protein
MKLEKPLVIELSAADKLKAIKRGLSAGGNIRAQYGIKEKVHHDKKIYSRRPKHPSKINYLEQ